MQMVVKTFSFSAAHRLLHHKGNCRFLHGHNWDLEIGVRNNPEAELKKSETSMICDFGLLKERISDWIDKNFDHNILLNKHDSLYEAQRIMDVCRYEHPFVFSGDPTVENISQYLMVEVLPLILSGLHIELCFIRLYETKTSYFEWRN